MVEENNGMRRTQTIYLIPVALVTLFIVWLILYKAGWKLGDDHQLLTATAVNKYIPFLVFPKLGRFFPLGLWHYNILLPISSLMHWDGISLIAHLVLNSIIYIITIISFYFLFNDIRPADNKKYPLVSAVFLCLFPLFSRAFIPIFMECVFPETIITLLLSIFILCYYFSLKTEKAIYYIISFWVAVYTTYCKEPISGIFIIIALTNLFLSKKNTNRYNYIFSILLLINGIIFTFLYYILSYRYSTVLYNAARSEKNIIELISVIVEDKIIYLIIVLSVIRLFFVFIKKDRDHIYYDSLLFASFGYILAYIALNLKAVHYFFPSIILSLPSFVYWMKYFLFKKKKFPLIVLVVLLISLCLSNFFHGKDAMNSIFSQRMDTKIFIKNIAADIQTGKHIIFYESDNPDTKYPFYKARRNWQKNVINCFVNYELKNENEIDYLNTTNKIQYINNNDVFLYPKANNNYLPMREDISSTLETSNFCFDMEIWDIFIYRPCAPQLLERNKPYSFSEDKQFLRKGRGWSTPEPGGIWSEGGRASIHVQLPNTNKRDIDIVINSQAFLEAAKLPEQTVEVSANGHSIGTLLYTLERNDGERTVKIPAAFIPDDGVVTLTFLIDKPTAPHDLGVSEDTRKLGFWLTYLQFR